MSEAEDDARFHMMQLTRQLRHYVCHLRGVHQFTQSPFDSKRWNYIGADFWASFSFQLTMMSSQQTWDIEFCSTAFIFTFNLAHAVQVSPCATRGISMYEMVPDDPNVESETLLKYDVPFSTTSYRFHAACNDSDSFWRLIQRTRHCAIPECFHNAIVFHFDVWLTSSWSKCMIEIWSM